jgi:hypothetical protein
MVFASGQRGSLTTAAGFRGPVLNLAAGQYGSTAAFSLAQPFTIYNVFQIANVTSTIYGIWAGAATWPACAQYIVGAAYSQANCGGTYAGSLYSALTTPQIYCSVLSGADSLLTDFATSSAAAAVGTNGLTRAVIGALSSAGDYANSLTWRATVVFPQAHLSDPLRRLVHAKLRATCLA